MGGGGGGLREEGCGGGFRKQILRAFPRLLGTRGPALYRRSAGRLMPPDSVKNSELSDVFSERIGIVDPPIVRRVSLILSSSASGVTRKSHREQVLEGNQFLTSPLCYGTLRFHNRLSPHVCPFHNCVFTTPQKRARDVRTEKRDDDRYLIGADHERTERIKTIRSSYHM
jgi:hypothetical protein